MTNEILFLQLDLVRERTLQQLELTTEETADIMPAGYNNTLRWHLGHIATVQESLCFKLAGEPFKLPETYPGLFANGTKPADWTLQPPTLEELKSILTEQPLRIKQKLYSRTADKLVQPFKGMDTVGAVIAFSLYHEGVHTGYMMSMRKTIAAL